VPESRLSGKFGQFASLDCELYEIPVFMDFDRFLIDGLLAKDVAIPLSFASASRVIRCRIGLASSGSCLLIPYRTAIRVGIPILGASARFKGEPHPGLQDQQAVELQAAEQSCLHRLQSL
jgi:hypothetical protein